MFQLGITPERQQELASQIRKYLGMGFSGDVIIELMEINPITFAFIVVQFNLLFIQDGQRTRTGSEHAGVNRRTSCSID